MPYYAASAFTVSDWKDFPMSPPLYQHPHLWSFFLHGLRPFAAAIGPVGFPIGELS